MRMPEYLSPSSLKAFEKNRDEFYLKYLAENRPQRLPQTQPMSVGSAFDAFVKSYIYHALYGNYGPNNEYERETIFTNQVEPHNRDFARAAGQHVFERYCYCGALSDMMLELGKAVGNPRFEFDIRGLIDSKIGGIPLLGKPDIFFINSLGARVIWDWKVNGYCAKSPTSPTKGYIKCRDTWESLKRKSSRSNGMSHKDCVIQEHCGLKINIAMKMETCNAEWADQLAIYSWLLGEEVGSEDVIVGIDQIVGDGPSPEGNPYLRVASHRTRISSDYQFLLLDRLAYAWGCITSGHIFQDMSREESDARIKRLDEIAVGLSSDDEVTRFVNQVARGG